MVADQPALLDHAKTPLTLTAAILLVVCAAVRVANGYAATEEFRMPLCKAPATPMPAGQPRLIRRPALSNAPD